MVPMQTASPWPLRVTHATLMTKDAKIRKAMNLTHVARRLI